MQRTLSSINNENQVISQIAEAIAHHLSTARKAIDKIEAGLASGTPVALTQEVLNHFTVVYEQLAKSLRLSHPDSCTKVIDDACAHAKEAIQIPLSNYVIKKSSSDQDIKTSKFQLSRQYSSSTKSIVTRSDPLTTSFGLDHKVALTFENVTKSCFDNPNRKLHPDFPKKHGFSATICQKSKSADGVLAIVQSKIPKSIQRFDKAHIKLHHTEDFYEHLSDIKSNPLVEESLYSDELLECQWYGPYHCDLDDDFYIFSINSQGTNSHFVAISFNYSSSSTSGISVYFA